MIFHLYVHVYIYNCVLHKYSQADSVAYWVEY